MPYIEQKQRKMPYNQTAGLLSYHIVDDILDFLDEMRCQNKRETNKYNDYALAIGVLELTKLELWRRLITSYEDKKKEENGDVF